jgi:hypothetical protein
MKPPIQILLDHEQTEVLTDHGQCFVVVSRAMSTEWPDVNGRIVLTAVPCSIAQANAGIRVATGQSAERRPRTPKTETVYDLNATTRNPKL